MPSPAGSPTLQKKFRSDFQGGTDYYAGIRQVADNESPLSTDVDFKGTGSVGSRQGYSQVGSVTSSRTQVWGMNEYHTSSLDYLVKFASNGSNIELGYSTGGAWTFDGSFTFSDQANVDSVQANGLLYSFNGTDAMQSWNGTTWSAVSNGKVLRYGAYYNNRLWGVDPSSPDKFWWSVSGSADFTSTGSGSLQIFPGAGARITAIHVFQNSLYVWLNGSIKGIFKVDPDPSVANNFAITLITNTVGCVSHRSVAQIENDVYFATDDGIYTLGAVAYYTNIRTTNKSLRMQSVFDSLSGVSKQRLVGKYFNFKYHLFYPLYGGQNDSCLVYDIRYQALQDWRNIAGQDATTYTDASRTTRFYFGHATAGRVYQMYSGSTDDGSAILSYWSSKSYDEGYSDTEKLYFDSTFIFSQLTGSVTIKVVFNDSQVASTNTITQQSPQGGFGFSRFGRTKFGGNPNTVSVTQTVLNPERLHAKGKKFAIQYVISSSSAWSLNMITQTFSVLPHYAFPSNLKVN